MKIKAVKTRIFRENEDLEKFILEHLQTVPEKSVLVVASKIVALSEGRTTILKSQKEKEKLIKRESDFALRTKEAWFTLKDGMVMASAGIDESNANGKLILLPKDSFLSAAALRRKLLRKFHIKNLGVLITDSGLIPLRTGVVGMAVGYAGFKGVKNYIGEKDIFGRILKISKTDVADSLAASAALSMGEGGEKKPIALITGAPVVFTGVKNPKELVMDPRKDIYAHLFSGLKMKRF